MKQLILCALILASGLLFTASGQKKNTLITRDSIGNIKLGMTVKAARRAAAPMKFTVKNNVYAGEYFAVTLGKKHMLNVWPGFEDAEVNWIEALDPSYATAEGVRVGMLLSEAEKIYGKVTKISANEEFLETAEFANHPRDILFRVQPKTGGGENAGIYENGDDTTTKYHAGVTIAGIEILSIGRVNEDGARTDFSGADTVNDLRVPTVAPTTFF